MSESLLLFTGFSIFAGASAFASAFASAMSFTSVFIISYMISMCDGPPFEFLFSKLVPGNRASTFLINSSSVCSLFNASNNFLFDLYIALNAFSRCVLFIYMVARSKSASTSLYIPFGFGNPLLSTKDSTNTSV